MHLNCCYVRQKDCKMSKNIPISHVQLVHRMVRRLSTGGFEGVSIKTIQQKLKEDNQLKDIHYLERVVVHMLQLDYLYECLDHLHVETVNDNLFGNDEDEVEDVVFHYMHEGCTIA